MKIYIAGKITGEPNFKKIFKTKEEELKSQDHIVLNPADLPKGLSYEEYMTICFAMIDVCDEVHFLSNWSTSQGAKREKMYAMSKMKNLVFEIGSEETYEPTNK